MGEDARTTIVVEGVGPDALLSGRRLRKPLVVKMDVQGAEAQALESAGALISEIDLMMLEYWPYGLRRMGSDPEKLLDLLEANFPSAAFTSVEEFGSMVSFSRVRQLINTQWTESYPTAFGDILVSRRAAI
jgi:hypothetical protein